MFKAQEKALQDSLTALQEALVLAKRNFAEQSEALKETGVQEISDRDRENQEDMQNETTKRIHEGLSCVVSSVQDLSEKAEIEEQQAKRQRKMQIFQTKMLEILQVFEVRICVSPHSHVSQLDAQDRAGTAVAHSTKSLNKGNITS